jgi:hypothetical protein
VTGDLDGDGRATVGVFVLSSATFFFRDGAAGGASAGIQYGVPGDVPFVGDWDGDGRDSVGVYRPSDSTYHLQGVTDVRAAPIGFGTPSPFGSTPVAGDWNGRELATNDDLAAIFGANVAAGVSDASLRLINAAMTRAGAVTAARKAAFLTSVSSASHFALDATAPGSSRYRGRGLVQLAGKAAYQRAGADLGVDLVRHPELATNPFVSAAAASWFWSVAHGVNIAADHLDIAAVGVVMGAPPDPLDNYARCTAFVAALRWFDGGVAPDGVNCDRSARTPWAALAMLPPAAFESLAAPAPAATVAPTAGLTRGTPAGAPEARSVTGTSGTPSAAATTSTTEAPSSEPPTTGSPTTGPEPSTTTTATTAPSADTEPQHTTTTAPAG